MRDLVDWSSLESSLAAFFEEDISNMGRKRHSNRVMLGLLLLQAQYNKSDKATVEELCENIYWQYFCGYEEIEKEVSMSESCVRRFRQKLGEAGLNMILSELSRIGVEIGAVKKKIYLRL